MSDLRWVAAVVFLVVTGWCVYRTSRLARAMLAHDVPTQDRRRASRGLMRTAALWECTIGAMLLYLEGWHALPNAIALVGTGGILMASQWMSERLSDGDE